MFRLRLPIYWTRRVNFLSWALFFIILFFLQLILLFTSDVQKVSKTDEAAINNNKGLPLKHRLNNQHEQPTNRILDRHDLKTLIEGIISKKLRPPDSQYNFNVSKSDSISLDRNITDTRPPSCSTKKYRIPKGITASVIVIFHNEALSILLRTVHSILNRTPRRLLKEVILVDDLSTFVDLGHPLDTYIRYLDSRVRILRNKKRLGLVRSRLRGADAASGDVLIWLDAHTECNSGWLEPLIHELNHNKMAIVQPHVDVISSDTIEFFAYPGEVFRGGFGWDLRYSWYKLPKYLSQSLDSMADPFPTPVLVGCAIAARKDHFDAFGKFDDGLNIWGGEHFDLSFRSWLCGGRVLTVPCSRVGHMFKEFTYSFVDDKSIIIRKNLMRIADIWLDEYKWIFNSVARSFGPDPQLTSQEMDSRIKRKVLRRKLNCKPFKWFLQNVMPEIKIPSVKDIYFGEITNQKTTQCWAPLDDGYIGMTRECFKHRILPENHFSLDNDSKLLHDRDCVYLDESNLLLRKQRCYCTHESKGGKWKFSASGNNDGQLQFVDHQGTQWCAGHVSNVAPKHYGQQMVQMNKCRTSDSYQLWTFTYKLSK